jgi:DNA-binding transcriptional LysR family regulator
MRLTGIDLNLLVILDAVLRERGVTAAARRVGLSQSAISHSLARLRDLIGDPILLRTKEGMVPTAKAEALAPAVREILKSSESVFLRDEPFDPASSREVFRAALDESAQLTILPQLVDRLRRLAPNTRLRIPTGTQPESMLRDFEVGHIDFAITSHYPTDARDLHAEFLLSAEYSTISRRDHPGVGRRLTLKRFVELDHISVTHPGLANDAIDGALAEQGLRREVVLSVPEPAAVASLVARTDLISTLPRMLIDEGGEPGGIVRHRPPIRLDPVRVFLIHHERTRSSEPHRWLREQIVEVFQTLATSPPSRGR